MNLANQLENCLAAGMKSRDKDLRIRDWRIYVHEAQALSLGIKENSPGNVYTPPSFQQGSSGEVYIIWEDGRLSQAHVQTASTAEPAKYWQRKLMDWRQAAYEDPEAAGVPDEPGMIPATEVEDLHIKNILDGEDQLLFDYLELVLKAKPEQAKMNAGIHAVWGVKDFRNSRGLSVSYPETQYSNSFSLDSLVGGGFAKKRLALPEEWESIWQRTLGYYEAMQSDGRAVAATTTVVFAPGVVEDLLQQFILPNFSGQGILEGQSAFKTEDFKGQKQVFREDLSLLVDPLQPHELGSYRLTAEGIPARSTLLVREGRLHVPILRLKDARRWHAEPTGVVGGTAGLYLETAAIIPWECLLSEIEDGILILSVLGMHTQNSVSGEYSLSSPQSLRIRNGKIDGKRAVKLQGNFFKDLAAVETRFAKAKLYHKPFISVQTGVQNI